MSPLTNDDLRAMLARSEATIATLTAQLEKEPLETAKESIHSDAAHLRTSSLLAARLTEELDTEKAAHAETRRLLEKAHNEGRSWMEYADELKDTVMAAEAEIATLTAERDAATSAVNHMALVQLKLQQDLAAAEKVCEEAEHHVGICGGGKLRRLLTTWRRTKEGT